MEAGDAVRVVDLEVLMRPGTARPVAWAHQSTDLNVNLLVLAGGEGVGEHVNDEVDVLLVVLAGDGTISVEGVAHPVRAGHALVIPKGTRRALSAGQHHLTYLTCHRRRAGLWPRGVPRPDERQAHSQGEQGRP